MAILEALLGNLNEKNKRLAVAGGLAVATFFLVWVAVAQPTLQKLKYLDTQKSELNEKGPILRDVLAAEARLVEYQKYMATDRDLSPLMRELSDLAEKSSLQNVSITLEKGFLALDGEVEKLGIMIEASGSFHHLGQYISGIENLDRFVKVSRIDFGRAQSSTASSNDASSKPGLKRFTMLASTFYTSKELAAL